MNNVYEKLKEAKAEIEKLKAELRGKKGSLKNLKRSHDVQVNQIQEAISKVEKLEHELLQKSHAFIYAEPIYENHNLNLSLVEPQKQERTIDWLKRIKPSFEECELENYTLLDEISLLKFRLDSHVKLSQDLQHQLQMCKQFLEQEESHRKSLEVEVLDLKLQFEGINSLKDKDIENLRHALKTQERSYKESKYSNEKLEQENHRLRESQDARASYSLSALRSSLSSLEQTHKECVSNFTARKLEWRFQLEQMTETIDNNRSKMETKDATIEELEMELECSCSFKNEMELERQLWKLFVESLKKDLEENRVIRKVVENSLLAQVDFSESFNQEKYRLDNKLEEEENKIEYLQLHVFILEQALKEKETKASKQVSFRREFDSVVISKCNVEKTNEFEKESFIKEKNMATK